MALDKIYTADEAAERLRLTNRGVIKLARQHGLCSRRGRDYLFSEKDLEALWEIMREPPKSSFSMATPMKSVAPTFLKKDLSWLFGPPVPVDCREMEVLRAISRRRTPSTHEQIERAGPRTFEKLLRLELVVREASNDESILRVLISDKGKAQIAVVDRWIQKRIKHGKSGGGWARHLQGSK